MTETPANTPKPIGSTSSFFPGGSKAVDAPAFSAVGVGDKAEDKEREESGKGNGEDGGKGNDEDGDKVTVDEPALSGCGEAVGLGTEETPYRKELGTGVHWIQSFDLRSPRQVLPKTARSHCYCQYYWELNHEVSTNIGGSDHNTHVMTQNYSSWEGGRR